MGNRSKLGECELIGALRAGCDRAAEQLIRENIGWMLAVAGRLVNDHASAEDCVQTAFLDAFSKIKRFEGRPSLRTWLHRIVVNAALMKLRSLRHHDPRSIDDLLPKFDANGVNLEPPWERMATPAELLERREARALVLEKIFELPEDFRIVFLLRDIEEMSTKEVAASLSLTEASVKVRLHRARSALKKLLEPLLRKGELL